MSSDDSILEFLEQTSALRLLHRIGDRDRYVTELIRSTNNPSGIGSEGAIRKSRENLIAIGLMVEEVEKDPPYRTMLKATEKGKKAAEIVGKLLALVDSSQ